MKKITLSLVTALTLSTTVYANSDNVAETYNGFSYIGFGVETISYKESGTTADGKKFSSSADVSSPVYTSGSLINAGKYFDFSIDAASTLTPSQTDEKWKMDEYIVQENKFDAVLSDLKILAHLKINNNHRIVFGPNYEMFSMKRYSYVDPKTKDQLFDNTGNPISLNEERISTVFGTVGYWYEHAPFSNDGMRVKVSALYGQPLWRNAANTSTEEIKFDSTTGYFMNWSGYLGFEVTKGLELGLFSEYNFTKKEGADSVEINGNPISWPDNELETFRYGVSIAWNFNVK